MLSDVLYFEAFLSEFVISYIEGIDPYIILWKNNKYWYFTYKNLNFNISFSIYFNT